jgi:glutathione S-transferase
MVVSESGAIVEYLVEKAGGKLGAPSDKCNRLRYRQFLHYAEGSMMPPLLAVLVVKRLGVLGWPARKPILKMVARHLDYCNAELSGRPYFAGQELTAADIMMSFPLEAAKARAGLSANRHHVWDWLQRIHARPAYQRALKAGGPYAFA